MPNTLNVHADPEHLRDTKAPCESCGSKWTPDGRSLGALDMVHSEDCAYWLATYYENELCSPLSP